MMTRTTVSVPGSHEAVSRRYSFVLSAGGLPPRAAVAVTRGEFAGNPTGADGSRDEYLSLLAQEVPREQRGGTYVSQPGVPGLALPGLALVRGLARIRAGPVHLLGPTRAWSNGGDARAIDEDSDMPQRKVPGKPFKSHTAGHAVRRASVAQPAAPSVRLHDETLTAAQYDTFVTALVVRKPRM